MPKNVTESFIGGSWHLLTSVDVTEISIQNQSGAGLYLIATAGTSPPTDISGAVVLGGNQGLPVDLNLAAIWKGVIGANRLWARVDRGRCIVWVSHA